MKERPAFDFPVHVVHERVEHDGDNAAAYDGIFTAILNHRIWLTFVPAFTRDPWPPQAAEDLDAVRDKNEARRSTIALASYAVTSDDARAGTIEPLHDGHVFYVDQRELDKLLGELARFSESFPGLHDTKAVSELPANGAPTLQRYLLDVFVASGRMTASELALLGRGKHAS